LCVFNSHLFYAFGLPGADRQGFQGICRGLADKFKQLRMRLGMRMRMSRRTRMWQWMWMRIRLRRRL